MERSTSPETTITTDVIKKICVQLGYYRNPVCNEKLYLHRKGFEKIDGDAFTPYTDVKVLWLESNALSHIPCGKDSRRISVKPVEDEKEKSDKVESSEAKMISKRGNSKSAYVDCCADWKTAPSRQVQDGKGRNVDDALDAALSTATNITNNNDNVNEKQTNKETGESSQKSFNESDIVKDVFQSLYPTLRQLYLHNNLLREMPDLSGFQRLDSVNLSNNFVQSVRAHCEEFNAKAAEYEKRRQDKAKKLVANSKSMQIELRAKETEENKTLGEKLREAEKEEKEDRREQGDSPQQQQQQPSQQQQEAIWTEKEHGENKDSFKGRNSTESGSHSSTSPPLSSTMPTTTADAPISITLSPTTTTNTTTTTTINTDVPSRQETLDVWRNRVIAYTQFCTHTPLTVSDDGKISDDVPDEHRNPCSSLRTLNLSGNRLRFASDLLALLCHHNLTVLDLSHNQLDDGEAVLLVLERLPRLRSLRLSGNPLVRTLPRYRKTVLARCVELMHLDDRPVFAAERRLVTAWAHGGEEAERVERMQMRREAENEHVRRLEEFRTMVRRSRYLSEGSGSDGNAHLNSNSQNNNNNQSNNNNNHDYQHYASYTGIHDNNSTSVRTQTDGVTTETREGTSVSEELRDQGRVFMSSEYNDDDEPTSSESSENDNNYGGNYNDNIHTMTQGGLENNNELEVPTRVRHSTARGNVQQQRQQQQQTHESDEDEIAVYIPLGADR